MVISLQDEGNFVKRTYKRSSMEPFKKKLWDFSEDRSSLPSRAKGKQNPISCSLPSLQGCIHGERIHLVFFFGSSIWFVLWFFSFFFFKKKVFILWFFKAVQALCDRSESSEWSFAVSIFVSVSIFWSEIRVFVVPWMDFLSFFFENFVFKLAVEEPLCCWIMDISLVDA